MRSALTHLTVVVCAAALQPAVAQELNPAPDFQTVPDFDAAKEFNTEHILRSILQDAEGNYWFGTWRSGVYRFDGSELALFSEHDGLIDNQVRTILEDRHGMIWFETASGINRYDGEMISTSSGRDYTSKNNWQIKPNDLWLKGDSNHGFTEREGTPGVYRYDGTTFRYHVFPFEVAPERHGSYSVTGIDQSKGGRVWIATYSAVIGFDGKEFVTVNDASLGHTDDTGYLHARCVFEDSEGRLWIGNNGIGVVMREGDTTINFTQTQGVGRRDSRSGSSKMTPQLGDAPVGQPSLHRVFSIGEDRDGNLWFGTVEQGAWRYDGTTLRQFTEEDGLHTKQVTAIYTDHDGDLWLGGNGAFKFNGKVFEQQF